MTEKQQESLNGEDIPANTEGKKLTRRAMLAKLGLLGAAIYAAPVLINLSDAEARSRSRTDDRRRRRRKNRNRRVRRRARRRSRT
jgi:hypothetical protein